MPDQGEDHDESIPKRDVSAIPEEPSQIDEDIMEIHDNERDDEEERSEATTNTTSISSPNSSNRTESSSRLENGDPIPRFPAGLFQKKETAPLSFIPTVVSELTSRGAFAPLEVRSIPSIQGSANPAVHYTNDMRGPPPHWMPPRPPSAGDPMLPHKSSSRYEDEENYEDPEQFNRLQNTVSPFGSLKRQPVIGNSYEISTSAQSRSIMRDTHPSSSGMSDDEFYLNQPHTVLHKNEAGAYYIPSGTLSHHSTGSPLSTSVRYHDERCLPPSSFMVEHSNSSRGGGGGGGSSTALLHSNKRTSSRLMGTPLPSTTIPPLSGSLKKRPPSRSSSSSLKDVIPPCSPFVLCLIFSLILSVGFIVVLLLRVPSPDESSSSNQGLNAAYGKDNDHLHALPERIRLGETVYVDLIGEEETQLYIQTPMRVSFNATVSPSAKIAVMGKLAGSPSTADHDLLWKLTPGESLDQIHHRIENSPRNERQLKRERKRRGGKKRNINEDEEDEPPKHKVNFEKFLLAGTWYLRFINDRKQVEGVTFNIQSHPIDSSCYNSCSGKGECIGNGICRCEEGYSGENCEKALCPVQCSGNGRVINGVCVCDQGYKGIDCSLRLEWCEVPDCSSHGRCTLEGKCICNRGWTGRDCNEKNTNMNKNEEGSISLQTDCIHPSCNGNGICSQGRCYCNDEFTGLGCERRRLPIFVIKEEKKKDIIKKEEEHRQTVYPTASTPSSTVSSSSSSSIDIIRTCSSHGHMKSEEGICLCENGWTGDECDIAICSPSCINGDCRDGKCVCLPGWKGIGCGRRECSFGCSSNGKCEANGSCTCNKGWNGDNCYIDGCPSGCSGHGECRKRSNGDWSCHCEWPFTGIDCATQQETQCTDGIDNDGDGLGDCDDPDCCDVCSKVQGCTIVPSPLESLNRMKEEEGEDKWNREYNQLFINRVRFLSRDSRSVQSYQTKPFDPSLISVLRGRLVYRHPLSSIILPLRGSRVSDLNNAHHGFTLTRNDTNDGDGVFDLVVDGGRSVTLQFLRTPFSPLRKIVYVPPNQIIHIGDIFMDNNEKPKKSIGDIGCSISRVSPSPIIIESWSSSEGSIISSNPSSNPLPYPRILADSRTVGDEIPIRGSSLGMIYDSSRVSSGELRMRLTEESIDINLRLVHIEITVAGKKHSWTLAARPLLRHTFVWNRKDAYDQLMRGLVPATVKIGYEWMNCTEIIWNEERVQLEGSQSDGREGIGKGWTINRLHYLDLENESCINDGIIGVLERGDGGRQHLSALSRWEATTVIGTSTKRVGPCTTDSECLGYAEKMPLAGPTSLATGIDGSIYVVDHDLIRRITPDGAVRTVMTLKGVDAQQLSAQMSVEPRDGSLYVAIPSQYQIVRISADKGAPGRTDKRTVLEAGLNEQQIIAGTGEMCLSSSIDSCGDDGEASLAKLIFPKAIAFDSLGRLYVADGHRIRIIDAYDRKTPRLIRSIGDSSSFASHGPPSCPLSFNSPLIETSLKDLRLQWPSSISIDKTTNTVYVLDTSAVYAIKGERYRIVRGGPPSCPGVSSSNTTYVKGIAASNDGSIFLLERSGQGQQIVRISHIGAVPTMFAGGLSSTSTSSNKSIYDRVVSRSRLRLSDTVAITVDARGRLIVADRENAIIRRIGPRSFELRSNSNDYRLADPERNEVYLFNKHGLHIATQDMLTGRFLLNFTYESDSSDSLLSGVLSGDSIVKLTREDEFVLIETKEGRRTSLTIRDKKLLKVDSNGYDPIKMQYSTDGLMTERVVEGGPIALLLYTSSGHIQEMVSDGGLRIDLDGDTVGTKGDHTRMLIQRGSSINDDRSIFIDDQSIKIDQDSSRILDLIPLGWSGAHLSNRLIGRSDLFDAASLSIDNSGSRVDLIGAESNDDLDTVISVRKTSLHAIDGRSALSSRIEWSTTAKRTKGSYKIIRDVIRKAKINGSPLMSIQYKKDDGIDSYIGPLSQDLLKVRYNDKGKIVSIGAEVDALIESNRRLPLLEMTRDDNGRLIEINWGIRKQRFNRDVRGRIESMTSSSNISEKIEEWSRRYGDEHDWPLGVNLNGIDYSYTYFDGGRISEVSRGDERTTMERLSLVDGGELRRRRWGFSNEPFIIIINPYSSLSLSESMIELNEMKWIEWRSSDGQRHSTINRDQKGRIKSIDNGDITTTILYHNKGEVRQCRSPTVDEHFKWHGGLVTEKRIATRMDTNGHWQDSTISLHYDDLLRVRHVDTTIHGHGKEILNLGYDARTHRLQSIDGFSVTYEPATTKIQEGTILIERRLGATRQISSIHVQIGAVVCDVQITHDALDRPLSSIWKLKSTEGETTETHTVLYDEYGRITNLTRGTDERTRWRLTYESNGRLSIMNNDSIEWNENGLIDRMGIDEYENDSNGWTSKRGPLLLDYDSIGRLIGISSKLKNIQSWSMDYDINGRMVMMRNGSTVYRLFYALPHRSHLLTHFTRTDGSSPSILFTLLYTDNSDQPFILKYSSSIYVIIYDEMGQLSMLLSDRGIARRIVYGTFGDVIIDTNPSLFIPFGGFNGGIPLPDASITVFKGFESRPWDTKSGRYLSFGPSSLLSPSTSLLFNDPSSIIDPFHLPHSQLPYAPSSIPRDISEWLNLVDIPIDIISRIDSYHSLSIDSAPFISSRILNGLQHRLTWLSSFPSVPNMDMNDDEEVPQWNIDTSSFSSLLQITLLPNNKTFSTLFSSTLTDEERHSLDRILSEASRVASRSLLKDSGADEEIHFVHGDEHLPADVQTASLPSFTIQRSQESIEVKRLTSKIIVHYGKQSIRSTRDSIGSELRRVWDAIVWKAERRRIESGRRPLKKEWTVAERKQLIDKGTVTGYSIRWRERSGESLPSIYSFEFVKK